MRSLIAFASASASKVISERAREAYADLRPLMEELRNGRASFQAIAEKLHADGHTARRGRPWTAVQVSRVLGRAALTGTRPTHA